MSKIPLSEDALLNHVDRTQRVADERLAAIETQLIQSMKAGRHRAFLDYESHCLEQLYDVAVNAYRLGLRHGRRIGGAR